MKYTVTKLRQNLYKILDSVIEEGANVEIERKGYIFRIVAEEKPGFWDSLEAHDIVQGNSDDLASLKWEDSWKKETGV
jgi:hypothetical protein